jgi:type IV pilus assembly protein PilA
MKGRKEMKNIKNILMIKFKKKGFTLIEVIVAVTIVVVLASLSVPKVTGYINKARNAKIINIGKQMYTAVMWSYGEQGNTINETQINNTIAGIISLSSVPTVTKATDDRSVTITFTSDSAVCTIVITPEENNYLISKNSIGIFNSNGIVNPTVNTSAGNGSGA